MHVILINGEKQVGKSTFAKALRIELNRWWETAGTSDFDPYAGVYSVVEPLAKGLPYFFPQFPGEEYEALKTHLADPFLGITGRDIMIAFGNAARSLHQYLLTAVLLNQAKRDGTRVAIVENFGLEEEWAYFKSAGIQVTCVHLNTRQVSDTKPGDRYPDDNRFNLEHLCEYLNPSIPDMCRAITGDSEFEFTDTLKVMFQG